MHRDNHGLPAASSEREPQGAGPLKARGVRIVAELVKAEIGDFLAQWAPRRLMTAGSVRHRREMSADSRHRFTYPSSMAARCG